MIQHKWHIYIFLLTSIQAGFALADEEGAKSLFAGEVTSMSMNVGDESSGAEKAKTTHSRSPSKSASSERATTTYGGVKYWVMVSTPQGMKRVTTSYHFKSGDKILLKVVPNVSGYMYVYNKGTSGKQTILYPSSSSGSGYVVANQEYPIPSSGMITFDSNPGSEDIGVFLTQNPMPVGGDRASIKSSNVSASAVSYTQCGTKDLSIDLSCASEVGGSKDLLVENDAHSATPAEYAVTPISDFDDGRAVSLKFSLIHD